MWDLSDKSTPTCERIVKVDLHADLLKCLSWDTLSAASLNESKWNAKRDLVKALNGVLHNVVRRAGTARAAFRRCNAVDVLQKLRNVNNYPVIRLCCHYTIIAFITTATITSDMTTTAFRFLFNRLI